MLVLGLKEKRERKLPLKGLGLFSSSRAFSENSAMTQFEQCYCYWGCGTFSSAGWVTRRRTRGDNLMTKLSSSSYYELFLLICINWTSDKFAICIKRKSSRSSCYWKLTRDHQSSAGFRLQRLQTPCINLSKNAKGGNLFFYPPPKLSIFLWTDG